MFELEDIPFDLFACVDDAVDMVAAKAGENNLALAALFTPNLPTPIIGDPLRLRQILVNLLANAIKFTTHGHVIVEVTAEAATGNARQLAFHVRDTGIGIPAERIGGIFAPYAQADASTARFHGGTGLGLPICRQLAERMDGAITVESTAGEGSTFTCTIGTRVAEPEPGATDKALNLSGIHVLVVNQQAVIGEAISRHLTDWGAAAVMASSIDAAVGRSRDWQQAAVAIIDASDPATLADDIARLTAASPNSELPTICITTPASRSALARAGELRLSVSTPIRRDHLRMAVLAATGLSSGPQQRTDGVPPPTRRVLYVDDNPMMTRLVERIFAADPSVTVQTAPDGATAIDLVTQQQPDIVLLDLNLADMSGEDLMRQFRADPRTRPIPVAIVSGDAAPETIERLTSSGAAAYLTKPFTSAQLRQFVDAHRRPPGDATATS